MSICPICNGFSHLEQSCPSCSHLMEDTGNIEQFFGPYSPYRERDDIKMANGYLDVARHECIHLLSCQYCGREQTFTVKEIKNPDFYY
jgi:hypothetical protein